MGSANFFKWVNYLESCLLALFGGIAGIALTFPAAEMFRTFTGTLFPVFEISNTTIIMQVLLSLLTGAFAAIFPAWKANTVNIVGALGHHKENDKKIPITYSFRNLFVRKMTTLFTIMGLALVVFVFCTVVMLNRGLEETVVATGERII